MKRIVASNNIKKRIIQISLDIEIPADSDGEAVAEAAGDAVEDFTDYNVLGASFQEDLTKEYVELYGIGSEDIYQY